MKRIDLTDAQLDAALGIGIKHDACQEIGTVCPFIRAEGIPRYCAVLGPHDTHETSEGLTGGLWIIPARFGERGSTCTEPGCGIRGTHQEHANARGVRWTTPR